MSLSNRITLLEEKQLGSDKISEPQPLAEKQPAEGLTPSNELLPLEEKKIPLEGKIEGQSIEATKDNTVDEGIKPHSDPTPSNDDLPIEVKIDGVLSELEGQHSEVTENNIEGGLLGKELALKIGLLRKDGQPADDILSKWVKLREEGKTSINGKNSRIYAEFLKWEKKGDYWFPIN